VVVLIPLALWLRLRRLSGTTGPFHAWRLNAWRLNARALGARLFNARALDVAFALSGIPLALDTLTILLLLPLLIALLACLTVLLLPTLPHFGISPLLFTLP
jgi:hypothetical protein